MPLAAGMDDTSITGGTKANVQGRVVTYIWCSCGHQGVVDQLDGLLRLDVRQATGLSPQFREHQHEETEQERADQYRMIAGEFEIGFHCSRFF